MGSILIAVIVFVIAVSVSYIGFVFSGSYNDMMRRTCISEIGRTLYDAKGFIETVDGKEYITQDPKIVEKAILETSSRCQGCKDLLLYQPGLRMADLLPEDTHVYQIGAYLYFPFDKNGDRIKWGDNSRKIILLDTRPLSSGELFALHADAAGYGY